MIAVTFPAPSGKVTAIIEKATAGLRRHLPAADGENAGYHGERGDPARQVQERSGFGDLAVSVVGRLFRLAPRLMDLLELGTREYGPGFARGRVLWALRESGPVLMRALSQALGISPRTVTGLVDSLEADGWVTRSPHPTDRRATIIGLTPAAQAALARLDQGYRGLAHDLLGDVPPGELDRLRTVISTLETRLEAAVARSVAAFEAAPRPQVPGSRRDRVPPARARHHAQPLGKN